MCVDVTHTTNIRPKRLVIIVWKWRTIKIYLRPQAFVSLSPLPSLSCVLKGMLLTKKQNMRSRSLYDGGNNRTRRKYTHTATLSAINIYTHSAYIGIACFFYFPHQHFCTFMSNNNNNKWVNKRIEWRWMYFS